VSFLALITTFDLIFPMELLDKTVIAVRALAAHFPVKMMWEGGPTFSWTSTLLVER
jgi:putative Ca2+/H+ antiporter (TMEM165/GDT1 family)